jgi:response regulator of citrate/malate metabolism
MNAASGDEADQATVDSLYNMLRGSRDGGSKPRLLPPTMAKILRAVQDSSVPVGASEIAALVGVSRPTAQRYLSELHRRGVLELDLEYGSTGRPINLYRGTSH